MTVHLYLSFIPEALIASELSPEQFGEYYTGGDTKKHKEQAMFVELDPDFRHEFFRIDEGIARCVPHADGKPKKSVYISTYRVLEHMPIGDFDTLYLVTRYGQTLALQRSADYPKHDQAFYLYQEIAPVSVLVTSTLGPVDFYRFITQDPNNLVHMPAICFVDLSLGALADDPAQGEVGTLPYDFIPRLRQNLLDLQHKSIRTKMVDRTHTVEYPYRVINSGIYLGNTEELAYFPLPSREELETTHYAWWRSANK